MEEEVALLQNDLYLASDPVVGPMQSLIKVNSSPLAYTDVIVGLGPTLRFSRGSILQSFWSCAT